jgi:hypothetical protein
MPPDFLRLQPRPACAGVFWGFGVYLAKCFQGILA